MTTNRQQALAEWQAEFLPRIGTLARAVTLLRASVEEGDVKGAQRALELAETRLGLLVCLPLGPAYPDDGAA